MARDQFSLGFCLVIPCAIEEDLVHPPGRGAIGVNDAGRTANDPRHSLLRPPPAYLMGRTRDCGWRRRVLLVANDEVRVTVHLFSFPVACTNAYAQLAHAFFKTLEDTGWTAREESTHQRATPSPSPPALSPTRSLPWPIQP
jgi:hypothetical protein